LRRLEPEISKNSRSPNIVAIRNSTANIIAYAVPISPSSINTIIVSLIPIPDGDPGVINPRSQANEKQIKTRKALKMGTGTSNEAISMNKTLLARMKKHRYTLRMMSSSYWSDKSEFMVGSFDPIQKNK